MCVIVNIIIIIVQTENNHIIMKNCLCQEELSGVLFFPVPRPALHSGAAAS